MLAQRAEIARPCDVLAGDTDGAGARRLEPDDEPRHRRLAAAALADEPQGLALGDLERDAVHRVHLPDGAAQQPFSDREMLDQPRHRQQGRRTQLRRARDRAKRVSSHLPSRFDEGYGVRSDTLVRLADDGCGLVLTVDCGITAVEEIAEAKARGLDVVVTDHHRPGDQLPDCPVVATRPSEYPFPELCGTGVVYKLGQALFGVDLDVNADNARAIAFYGRHGFIATGSGVNVISGKPIERMSWRP